MEQFKKYALWFFKSFIWLGILLFVIDIVTKNVVIANQEYILSQQDGRIDVIPGFVGITYLVNRNAAFGIGTTSELANRIIYIIISSIASIGIIFVYVKNYSKLGKFYKACMMMILVGALGNLVDRVFYSSSYLGYPDLQPGVVDWIDFYGVWPYVFNIADSSIVIGVIMLIVYLIIEEVKDSKERNKVTLKKDVVEAKIEAQKEETEAPKEEKLEEIKVDAPPIKVKAPAPKKE